MNEGVFDPTLLAKPGGESDEGGEVDPGGGGGGDPTKPDAELMSFDELLEFLSNFMQEGSPFTPEQTSELASLFGISDYQGGGAQGGDAIQRLIQLINPNTDNPKFPSRSINLVDTRTPEMLALEQAMVPTLTDILSNPSSAMDIFGNAAGAVPGAQGFNQMNPAAAQGFTSGLSNLLFGNAGGVAGGGGGGQPQTGDTGNLPRTDPGGDPGAGGGGPEGGFADPITQPGFQQPNQQIGFQPPTPPEGATEIPNVMDPNQPSFQDWMQHLFTGADPQQASNTMNFFGGNMEGTVGGEPGYAPYYGRGLPTGAANLLRQIGGVQLGAEARGADPNYGGINFMGDEQQLVDWAQGILSGDLAPTDQLLESLSATPWQMSGSYYDPTAGAMQQYDVNQQFSPDMLPQLLQGIVEAFGGESRATGGPFDPNTPTLVGEQGPELLMNNEIIPLNQQSNAGNFSTTNQPAGGYLQQTMMQNPEMDVFNQAQGALNINSNPGQGVVDALQPVFQQNLDSSLASLRNMSPSTFNSGIQAQGGDIAQRSLNDFNLLASQALQQGVNQQQQGASVLGQLAGQAGQNPFNRALNAGQLATQRDLGFGQLAQNQQQFLSDYGLRAQQQQWNQQVAPALQLLLSALGIATPTGYQTVAIGG